MGIPSAWDSEIPRVELDESGFSLGSIGSSAILWAGHNGNTKPAIHFPLASIERLNRETTG